MNDKYPVWEKLDKAERHGSFIEIAMNGGKASICKTIDVDSSIETFCRGMDNIKNLYVDTARYRKVIYRRIEVSNNKQKVIVWDDQGNAVISKFAFDSVYYLPFHECFLGYCKNMLFLFDADISKEDGWYLYSENFKKCYVFGKFILYSADGGTWGMVDGETHKKIPPFFKFFPTSLWKMRYTWVDDFLPVKVEDFYSFMDCHGNCFGKLEKDSGFMMYANVILEKSTCVFFGFDSEKKIPVQRGTYSEENTVGDNFVIWPKMPDAFGKFRDITHLSQYASNNKLVLSDTVYVSYYGEVFKKVAVNTYTKVPLKLHHYELKARIKPGFFVIKNGNKFGLINEETNEIVAEPVYNEVIECGDGFRLTYGNRYIYLDELGRFVEEKVRSD